MRYKMDLIIESFRRLYQSGQINETTLLVMLKNKTITVGVDDLSDKSNEESQSVVLDFIKPEWKTPTETPAAGN